MSELKVRDIMAYNKLVLESEQSGFVRIKIL